MVLEIVINIVKVHPVVGRADVGGGIDGEGTPWC